MYSHHLSLLKLSHSPARPSPIPNLSLSSSSFPSPSHSPPNLPPPFPSPPLPFPPPSLPLPLRSLCHSHSPLSHSPKMFLPSASLPLPPLGLLPSASSPPPLHGPPLLPVRLVKTLEPRGVGNPLPIWGNNPDSRPDAGATEKQNPIMPHRTETKRNNRGRYGRSPRSFFLYKLRSLHF